MAGKELSPPGPSPSYRQQVNCVIGLLMGGITHGCITRAGQAVSGPLTGAAFPECLAAVPQRHRQSPLNLPTALCWRVKRVHLPQTQVIRFSPGPYTANWENTMLLLLLLLSRILSFTSNHAGAFTIESVAWEIQKKKKKRDRKALRMSDDDAQKHPQLIMIRYSNCQNISSSKRAWEWIPSGPRS